MERESERGENVLREKSPLLSVPLPKYTYAPAPIRVRVCRGPGGSQMRQISIKITLEKVLILREVEQSFWASRGPLV